ncbi:cytochrome p450 [Diplodia corticola]|uniref:Cytochrome p450 n=1 Tax=Diplodia corticola TaxID=236234 RepID=A0A1J9RIU5_9PEZI|nr:cytochrome p450 [Diplodia corticola]OJD32475.1 cytochrome p450 [Diplodia corticola]
MLSAYPLLLLGLAALVVLSWKRRARDRYYGLPTVGRPDDTDFRNALEQGARKYPDDPYVIPDDPPMVILPHRMVERVKSLPEAQASADKNVYRRGLGQYTDLGNPLPALFDGIRVDLTRHIRDLIPGMQEAIALGFDDVMDSAGGGAKHAAVCVFPAMKRIVAHSSAAAFVGPELARDGAWIAATMQYSTDLKMTFAAFHRIAPLLRPLAAPFLFRRLGISERRRAVEQMLDHHQNQAVRPGEPERLIDWVWARLSPHQRTPQMVARTQLRAALAGSDTVAHTLTNAVYDLAAHPDCAQELRAEIEATAPGVWDMARLKKLVKMDSFLRESARLHPIFMTAVGRVLTAPLPLDDGRPALPAGAVVGFSQNLAHFDASTQPGPADRNAFDPWRFSRLRSAAAPADDANSNNADARLLFTTTGDSNLTFGHGVHACPGRFFADAEIKLILVHLLLAYDVALPEGTVRPRDTYVKFTVAVDRSAAILFKPRL